MPTLQLPELPAVPARRSGSGEWWPDIRPFQARYLATCPALTVINPRGAEKKL